MISLGSVGCTANVAVRTNPPGAHLFVNENAICTTPCTFEQPSIDVTPAQLSSYRIEKGGYETASGKFKVGRSRGRTTGMVFTLGILRLFISPWVFVPQEIDVDLTPIDPVSGLPVTREMAEQLKRVDALYAKGLIGDEERRQHRADILLGKNAAMMEDDRTGPATSRQRCLFFCGEQSNECITQSGRDKGSCSDQYNVCMSKCGN